PTISAMVLKDICNELRNSWGKHSKCRTTKMTGNTRKGEGSAMSNFNGNGDNLDRRICAL
ncbi:hypothetical protein, partial [Methylicorpusculum sp.]|uniref:hypothetical protein n=1 Tax=Methylicorpusculum sp. TaxID=2713644 RepID=UPI002ABCD187